MMLMPSRVSYLSTEYLSVYVYFQYLSGSDGRREDNGNDFRSQYQQYYFNNISILSLFHSDVNGSS